MFLSIIENRDLYTKILEFLSTNSDVLHFLKVSKDIFKLCYDYGFIKKLTFYFTESPLLFLKRFNNHSKVIKDVIIKGVDDGHIWLPLFTTKVHFENIKTPSVLKIPGTYILPTVHFIFTDYQRGRYKKTLKINWSRFKKLKKLKLIVWDVDLTGLNIEELESYYIDTNNGVVRNKY